MNKKIFDIARQAGATTNSYEVINETTDVWFSSEEFEKFITLLVEYQVSVMSQVITNGMKKDALNV